MNTIREILKPIAQKISNKKIRNFIIHTNNKLIQNKFKKNFFTYYEKTNPGEATYEIKVIINFLKKNVFNLFPYEFIKKYNSSDIEIFTDVDRGLKYAFLYDKKIYFKKKCTNKEAQEIYRGLILVQDYQSPHRYLSDDFNVSKNDIVADIGAAEGDFTLSIIDKVKKVYLFETDTELIEALKATFEPWKEKVEIINKYVSNKVGDSFITIDSFFENKEVPTFLKVDIEGAEYDLIQGAKKTFRLKYPMKVIMASYHKHNDEIILRDELKKNGFDTKYTKGYMLSTWDGVVRAPYVRRALIKAKK